ncbi:MAG TPA: hypothetical protein VIC08_09990 [Cellvibrionaceae bacterium]
MKKVAVTLALVMLAVVFWFGELVYFINSDQWQQARLGLEQSPQITAKGGPVRDVSVSPLGFSKGTAGWGNWVRLQATVSGEKNSAKYRIYLEKRAGGSWRLVEASEK